MTDNERKDLLASLIKESREAHGWTQQKLADALGVSKKTYQNWEFGLSMPPFDIGFKICQVLGEPIGRFVGRYLFPDSYEHEPEKKISTEQKRERITDMVQNHLTDREIDQQDLAYRADYGSRIALSNLRTLYIHLPLIDRQMFTILMMHCYEDAIALGKDPFPEEPQPDIEILSNAVSVARLAAHNGEKSYTL